MFDWNAQTPGDSKTPAYAETLGKMLRFETISAYENIDQEKFEKFRELLAELFPTIFSVCEIHRFPDAVALRWKGSDESLLPVLFMNHHDVVQATGDWSVDPFSGVVKDGKIWGRGALDDKGPLWAMLQAAEELAAEQFVPRRDIWLVTSSTEETTGNGAKEVVAWFLKQGMRFEMTFDEGGVIIEEPVPGAKDKFAIIGVGEKGCADLKFTARSKGGHASMPPKDTPLVRLGKFMAEVDRGGIFDVKMDDTTAEMFRRLGPSMGKAGMLLKDPKKTRLLLEQVLPRLSPTVGAMFHTTIAFTMASGSDGRNVIPQEAWVIGNMRYSHHEGRNRSFAKIKKIAAKYDIELEILDPGDPSEQTDFNGKAFRLMERAIAEIFPGVTPLPFIETGATDSRFFTKVSDQNIRFAPFTVSDQQLSSAHGIDENLDVDSLLPAVNFFRYLMREV